MFVLNRATPEAAAALQPEIERLELPLVATVPEDGSLFEAEVAGRSLLEMPDDSPAVDGTTLLFDKIFAAA
jgi:CO dehydrogenase nickel-insertion accessory protein CooC1